MLILGSDTLFSNKGSSSEEEMHRAEEMDEAISTPRVNQGESWLFPPESFVNRGLNNNYQFNFEAYLRYLVQ